MQAIGEYSLTESILYGDLDVYHWTDDERLDFQFKIIREAFQFHFDNCDLFRRFCSSEGFSPRSILSPQDITRIPLIPSSMFKSLEVRTGPEKNIAKVCSSSGTRGSVSRVARDELSLERFVGSIRIAADQLLDLHADAQIFNLGPETAEAGDIWFPYVMSLLGLLRPTENYVANGIFYPRSLLEDLLKLGDETQPVLVGPPIFFLYFMQFLAKEGVSIDLARRDGLVITAGGWKSFSREQINQEEFISQCLEYLGMNDQRGIRDAYNMVELNTVIFECGLGVKHIPPWLVVASLDPGTLALVGSNEMGLLAFFDPLPISYPGFILSDDFGSVNSDSCGCGRSGPTMKFHRRVALAEGRGCALTMDRNIKVTDKVKISEHVHVQ